MRVVPSSKHFISVIKSRLLNALQRFGPTPPPQPRIILQLLHVRFHRHAALIRKTNGEAWQTARNNAVPEIGEH